MIQNQLSVPYKTESHSFRQLICKSVVNSILWRPSVYESASGETVEGKNLVESFWTTPFPTSSLFYLASTINIFLLFIFYIGLSRMSFEERILQFKTFINN